MNLHLSKSLVLFSAICLIGISIHAQPFRFLALGDSYTIGESVDPSANWPSQLGARLGEIHEEVQVDIIARTGWRTDQLIDSIKQADLTPTYDLVSVLIGVNNQYQGRSFDQYKEELPAILSLALEAAGGDSNALCMVSIPDYAYTPFGAQAKNQNISSELDVYNDHARSLCNDWSIPFIDITPISRSRSGNLLAQDGLHPSAFQYEQWVKEVLEVLRLED